MSWPARFSQNSFFYKIFLQKFGFDESFFYLPFLFSVNVVVPWFIHISEVFRSFTVATLTFWWRWMWPNEVIWYNMAWYDIIWYNFDNHTIRLLQTKHLRGVSYRTHYTHVFFDNNAIDYIYFLYMNDSNHLCEHDVSYHILAMIQ